MRPARSAANASASIPSPACPTILSVTLLARPVSPTIGAAAMDVDDIKLSQREIDELARRVDRPVVLVGMMGVGKSSVCKRLAAMLHCPFLDADDEIERSAQMTIAEIFAAYGEAHFRDGERRVIARLIDENDGRAVIATGGGAFVYPQTRSLILDKAIAI